MPSKLSRNFAGNIIITVSSESERDHGLNNHMQHCLNLSIKLGTLYEHI